MRFSKAACWIVVALVVCLGATVADAGSRHRDVNAGRFISPDGPILTPPVREQDPGIELPPEGISMEKMEEELVRKALSQTGGNQTQAARLLDISRDSLRYRMKKMGLLGGDEASGPST